MTARQPGAGYRAPRIMGTIVMVIGAAIAIFIRIMNLFCEMPDRRGATLNVSIALAIATLGLGIFFSSSFAEPPPDRRNGPAAS